VSFKWFVVQTSAHLACHELKSHRHRLSARHDASISQQENAKQTSSATKDHFIAFRRPQHASGDLLIRQRRRRRGTGDISIE